MAAQLGNLGLAEQVSILRLHDDALQQVVRSVRRNGDLPPFASTCSRVCRLARSRFRTTLRVRGTNAYRSLGGLSAGSGRLFSACERLVAAAEEGPGCHLLKGVLEQAAALSSLRALELSVSMPPNREAGIRACRQEGRSDGRGVLVSVASLQQLQQLKISTVILKKSCSKVLGQLTALTSLQLTESKEGIWGFAAAPPDDLSYLSRLVRLEEFAVHWRMAPAPPDKVKGRGSVRYALAPSLRRLSLKGDTAYWLLHLPACPHLEQLHLDYSGTYQHASAHPAAVLEVVARHTPGLQKLTCPYDSRAGFRKQLQLLASAATLDNVRQPLPAAAVAALASLQHLDVGRFLCVGEAEHWEALGRLKALTTLQGIIVGSAPPPGWRHRGVQQLGVVLPGQGAAATAVLLAFPAVRVADLRRFGAAGALDQQDLSPWSGMGSVEELLVDWSPAPPAAAAAAAAGAGAASASSAAATGRYGIPCGLLRLQVDGDATGWLQHLPGSPQLTELCYEHDVDGDEDATHPTAVLELAAMHTPGMVSFTCRPEADAVELAEQQVAEGLEQPPPPAVVLAQLSALKHLDAGCYLSVRETADWEVLGHLSALSSLRGIVVYQAPPLQWQHSRVEQLAVVLEGVGGEAAARVLLAFPAVQQAHLYVKGKPEVLPAATAAAAAAGGANSSVGTQQQQQQQGVPAELSSLTSLRLQYSDEYEYEVIPAPSHAAPILAAARGVVELSFDGACVVRGLNLQMPDLSGFTAVTCLRFGRSFAASVGHVMNMVLPLGRTLWVLELYRCRAIDPEAVIVLEQLLPRLKHVLFKGCRSVQQDRGESQAQALVRLQHQLHLGMSLSVTRGGADASCCRLFWWLVVRVVSSTTCQVAGAGCLSPQVTGFCLDLLSDTDKDRLCGGLPRPIDAI